MTIQNTMNNQIDINNILNMDTTQILNLDHNLGDVQQPTFLTQEFIVQLEQFIAAQGILNESFFDETVPILPDPIAAQPSTQL